MVNPRLEAEASLTYRELKQQIKNTFFLLFVPAAVTTKERKRATFMLSIINHHLLHLVSSYLPLRCLS